MVGHHFGMYSISEPLIEVLKERGYERMSPVQEQVIPRALRGESLMVKAKTGSGKTHAFLVPLIERLHRREIEVALVLAPTRELAKQIYDFARELNVLERELRLLLLAGGIERSKTALQMLRRPELIIATPGRFHDLALKETVISLRHLDTIIIDEADMLMDSGFLGVTSEILQYFQPSTAQLYSATIPQLVRDLMHVYADVSDVVTLDEEITTSETVTHYLIDVAHRNRHEAALNFIKTYQPYLLLIFCSTNKEVKELYEYLANAQVKVGIMSGDLDSRTRRAMMRRINKDEFPVIVASDIAARGIDIDNVSDVLNINFPTDLSFYFHRAGRTGRFAKTGNAYSFYNRDDEEVIRKLLDEKIDFRFISYRAQNFEEVAKPHEFSVHKRATTELSQKISKAVDRRAPKKVKPGYKKRRSATIDRIASKYKRKQKK